MRRIPMVAAVAGGVLASMIIVGAVVVFAGAQTADQTAAMAEAPATPSARADVDTREGPVVLEPPQTAVAPADAAPAAEPLAEVAPVEPAQEPEREPEPEPDASVDDWYPTAEEQATWLAFQQVVRDCMAQSGQEYLYWEWWNSMGGPGFAAMPTHLDADGRAAWELALHGDTPLGAEYDWRRAGCWGYAAELAGNSH